MEPQGRNNEAGREPFASDKSVADQLLKEHTVQVATVLNLTSLMPYLIQHGCLTDEDMDQFPRTESRKSNNLKFKRMIQERGVSAFNSFLRALAHFTRDERGEGAHRELLDSLESALKGLNYNRNLSRESRGSNASPQSSITTTHSTANRTIIVEATLEEVERDMAQPTPTRVTQPTASEIDIEIATQEGEIDLRPLARGSDPPTKDKKYRDITKFKYFLRFAVLLTCISSPISFIGGIVLIALSLSAFAGDKSCEEIVSAHSLTVFNLCAGFLCLTIPGLLIMLTTYYCCENRNSAWKREFRVLSTKCLVIWTTIGFFLTLFVLTVIELLYALVYVAPQVYSNYGDWNRTQCEGEVFLTSFWILNIAGTVVVFLVAVLGVYLSILYFRWVTNPKKPGTLRRLILTIFSQKSVPE